MKRLGWISSQKRPNLHNLATNNPTMNLYYNSFTKASKE